MSATNRHRIERQVLELDLVSPRRAALVQEEAAGAFRGEELAEMEALFDRLAGPGETVRLERLELDLGVLQGSEWRRQFLERLLAQLSESLAEAEPSPTEHETAGAPLRPARDGAFEQLLFFLAHGRLPWWGARPAGAWSVMVRPSRLDDAQWSSLGELLGRDERARARALLTLDAPFLEAAAAALGGPAAANRVRRALRPSESGPARRRWNRRFWELVLDFVVRPSASPDRGPELMRRLIAVREELAAGEAQSTGAITERAPRTRLGPLPEPTALPEPWAAWLEVAVAEVPAGADEPSGGSAALDVAPAARPSGDEPESRPEIVRRATDLPTASERADKEDENETSGLRGPGSPRAVGGTEELPLEPRAPEAPEAVPSAAADAGSAPATEPTPAPGEAVYVGGAGVTILHPFLNELFDGLELLAEGRFRDENARHRAVHLLGYLAFGGTETPEYELLLPKLLCDMPWEEPLPPAAPEEGDLEACDELLAAVLGHWEALQSASTEWMREQFFLRDGKLEPVDDGWKLTVERRAQDVLLSKLPWGLGLIRLPWSRPMLHVSWAD